MNTKKDAIRNSNNVFFNNINKILTSQLLTQVETVNDAVEYNLLKTHEEYKISDFFLWQSVMIVHKEISPLLNEELNTHWQTIYQFLYDCIGKNVEKNHQTNIDAFDEIIKFRNKNNLKTKFNLPNVKPSILFEKFPRSHNHLIYTESSGWGEPSSVSISPQATYADLWIAAEHLYFNSKDLQNKVLVNFISTNEGLVAVFDIE